MASHFGGPPSNLYGARVPGDAEQMAIKARAHAELLQSFGQGSKFHQAYAGGGFQAVSAGNVGSGGKKAASFHVVYSPNGNDGTTTASNANGCTLEPPYHNDTQLMMGGGGNKRPSKVIVRGKLDLYAQGSKQRYRWLSRTVCWQSDNSLSSSQCVLTTRAVGFFLREGDRKPEIAYPLRNIQIAEERGRRKDGGFLFALILRDGQSVVCGSSSVQAIRKWVKEVNNAVRNCDEDDGSMGGMPMPQQPMMVQPRMEQYEPIPPMMGGMPGMNPGMMGLPPPPQPPSAPKKDRVQCMHEYTGRSASELSMKPGDIVIVLSRDAGGWWQGILEKTGQPGWFPPAFTKPFGGQSMMRNPSVEFTPSGFSMTTPAVDSVGSDMF